MVSGGSTDVPAADPRTGFPLPPIELAARVDGAHANAFAGYEAAGERIKREILATLPADWTFAGKTVLDFGCGAGRVLRHFGDLARNATFRGCDIDGPSIAWLDQNLSPPFELFHSSDVPPLELETRSVDLVWALSVFTHLTDTWSAWLVELHRILGDDGLLLVTFSGPGIAPLLIDDPWDEDRIGMTVLHHDQGWALGGPMVLHSPWWIEAHWSRGFEILELREQGFASDAPESQGVVLMRKKPVDLTTEELERIDPDEPREIEGLKHQIAQLRRETNVARAHAAWLELQAVSEAPPLTPESFARRLLRGTVYKR